MVKKIYVVCTLLLLTACSNPFAKQEVSLFDIDAKIEGPFILGTKTFSFAEDSIELERYSAVNEYPMPMGLAYDKLYLSVAIKRDPKDMVYLNAKFMYLDLNTNVYTDIKIARNNSVISHFQHVISTPEFVVFVEINQGDSSVLYLYNFASKSLEKLLTMENVYPGYIFADRAVIIDEIMYLTLPKNEEVEDNFMLTKMHLYEYNFSDKTLNKVNISNNEIFDVAKSPNCIDCITFNEYTRLEGLERISKIFEYNVKTKEKTLLFESSEDIPNYVLTDSHFIVTLDYSTTAYDLKTKKRYLLQDHTEYIGALKFKKGQYLYYNITHGLESGRVVDALADLKTLERFEYKDSCLLLSDQGILWYKFNKKETEIGKFQIFLDGNSSIMYHKFDD